MPESGMPDAMPLAMTTMSGRASYHSVAKKRPVRPVAGLHLVGDEQDAVAVGHLAQGGEEAVGRDDVAALAEDRLHQERGHVIGVDERREQLVDLGQAVQASGRLGVAPGRVAQRVRVRREVHAAEERLEVAAVLDPGAGERHGPVGAAVEAAAEGDDRRPPGRVSWPA